MLQRVEGVESRWKTRAFGMTVKFAAGCGTCFPRRVVFWHGPRRGERSLRIDGRAFL